MIRIILCLLILRIEGYGQIAFVNSAVGQNATATNATPLSTATYNATANNIEICGVRQDNDTLVPSSVTDSGSNTYTHLANADSTLDTGDLLTLWWAKLSSGFSGGTTNANFNGGHGFTSIICAQFSGQDGTTPIDVNNITTASSATVTSVTSPTFTTARANEVAFICVSTASTAQGYVAGNVGGTTGTLIADAAGGSEMTACEYNIFSAIQTNITAVMTFNSVAGVELSGATIQAPASNPLPSQILGPSTFVGPSKLQ